MKKAVVLLSGGADSTTALYLALKENDEVHAIGFNYGQRHSRELDHARATCTVKKVPFTVVDLNLAQFGGSPLVDVNLNVPKQSANKQATTVVPYRNTLLIVLAAANARLVGANRIYIGATYEDLANYPDCRELFFEQLETTLRLSGPIYDLEICAPFVGMKKDEVIKMGKRLKVDYQLTHTCYCGVDYPCLECDSCRERMESFRLNKVRDPLVTKEDWKHYLASFNC